MGIQNKSDDLKQRILKVLEKTTMKDVPMVDESTGKVTKKEQTPALRHPDATPNIKITENVPLSFQGAYSQEYQVGIEALIDIIIKETLNYLQQNVEISMKTRMDTLETNFNALVAALEASGITLSSSGVLTPVGVALQAAAVAGGGSTRSSTITTPLKAQEVTQIK